MWRVYAFISDERSERSRLRYWLGRESFVIIDRLSGKHTFIRTRTPYLPRDTCTMFSLHSPHAQILARQEFATNLNPHILFTFFSFSLGRSVQASTRQYLFIKFCTAIPLLINTINQQYCLKMPIVNGDAMPGSTDITKGKIEDYSRALEILESEYPERDGVDVRTLLDSKTRGGLTYNDFLVLPGYIGTSSPLP